MTYHIQVQAYSNQEYRYKAPQFEAHSKVIFNHYIDTNKPNLWTGVNEKNYQT